MPIHGANDAIQRHTVRLPSRPRLFMLPTASCHKWRTERMLNGGLFAAYRACRRSEYACCCCLVVNYHAGAPRHAVHARKTVVCFACRFEGTKNIREHHGLVKLHNSEKPTGSPVHRPVACRRHVVRRLARFGGMLVTPTPFNINATQTAHVGYMQAWKHRNRWDRCAKRRRWYVMFMDIGKSHGMQWASLEIYAWKHLQKPVPVHVQPANSEKEAGLVRKFVMLWWACMVQAQHVLLCYI